MPAPTPAATRTRASAHSPHSPVPPFDDQAATLRRLFARRAVRTLPIVLPPQRDPATSTWIAKFATGFARQGERTLVIDAARVHVAASLGLRARYDLQHLIDGDCTVQDAVVDAAPGFHVLPAARAFEQAVRQPHAGATALPLRLVLSALAASLHCDLVLLLIAAHHAPLLPPDVDCVLPLVISVDPSGRASAAGDDDPANPAPAPIALSTPAAVAMSLALRDARQLARRSDIAGFRLLFLGMDRGVATTLAATMGSMAGTLGARLMPGGHALVARDLVHVVRAASGWRYVPMARMSHPVGPVDSQFVSDA